MPYLSDWVEPHIDYILAWLYFGLDYIFLRDEKLVKNVKVVSNEDYIARHKLLIWSTVIKYPKKLKSFLNFKSVCGN